MFKGMKPINKIIISSTLLIFLSFGIIGGCGSNPPSAPFGSTISLVPAPGDISICGIGLEPLLVRALVTNLDGLPLNGVEVEFFLSFAGEGSILVDTDGNGLPDAQLLQLVDNDACQPENCIATPIPQWFSSGAFVASSFSELTDDNGVAEVVILVPGLLNIFDDTGQLLGADPATLTVVSGSSVAIQEFAVNTDCDN
ncbi:MAG: hypothetical protein GTO02_03620 [Candidatus Dadabacteria bacterium]|nr:hypothetical protein [Candidatus Dadabacteria bacterium]NIQ13516.1 hypothetical protein [Candidatus Dadabacteria bacterium]